MVRMITSRSTLASADVVIVGGGIVGMWLAALCAQTAYIVQVVRMNDTGLPRAETLRNQGWLQSGVLYSREGGFRDKWFGLCAMTRASGLMTLSRLGLPEPVSLERGIVRVDSRQAGDELLSKANSLNLGDEVKLLSDSDAKLRLGEDLFVKGATYYSVPDASFDQAEVLRRLRHNAQRLGVRIINLRSPARVEPDASSPAGAVVCFGRERLRANVLVLAAGVGMIPLLTDLKCSTLPTLRQTPLLVLHNPSPADCLASVYVDQVGRFSFVRHQLNGAQSAAFVIGISDLHEEVDFKLHDHRRLTRNQHKEFMKKRKQLPAVFQRDEFRLTAGVELVPPGKTHLDRWIYEVPGYEGVMVVAPGRSTSALSTALDVLSHIKKRLAKFARPERLQNHGNWTSNIFMHYEDHYHFNDAN